MEPPASAREQDLIRITVNTKIGWHQSMEAALDSGAVSSRMRLHAIDALRRGNGGIITIVATDTRTGERRQLDFNPDEAFKIRVL